MEKAKSSWVEEKHRARDNPSDAFAALKRSAYDQFSRHGFPGTRLERWRLTDVSAIASAAWESPPNRGDALAQAPRFPEWSSTGVRLVFLDGLLQPQWSTLSTVEGRVEIIPFSQLGGDLLRRVQNRMAETGQIDEQPFLHLNTALMDEGVVVRIPDAVHLGAPVTLLHYSAAAAPVALHPRTMVLVGDRAEAAVIEYYAGAAGTRYFRNPVADVSIGDESRLAHYVLQLESGAAHHVSFTRSTQGRNSHYTRFAIDFGGSLVRHDTVAELHGEGGEAVLNGLYMPTQRQHLDHHTTLRHLQPHTFSRQLYKGVLNGAAHAVFNGRIHVAREAQKTDAIQYNRNLLLCDDALADTQPQLEIFADDVRCTHGGTIGQLHEDGLFYLRARGIGAETARHMMVHAFAGEVTERIKHEALRAQVDRWVLERLGWEG